MKNSTLRFTVSINKGLQLCIVLLTFLFSFSAIAQRACNNAAITAGSLNFAAPTFVSGTNNGNVDLNDVYRFSNVVAGVDALVQLTALTGTGGTGSVPILDSPAVTEGVDGYNAAFQPTLRTNGGNPTSATFVFTFVTAGGTAASPVRLNFYASALDVDGNGATLREYDELTSPDAYFRENPSGLTFSTPTGFVRGLSTATAALGGTSTASSNAFTCYYENRSSFTYTVGTQGNGASIDRLKSLYFQDITYTNRVTTVLTPPLICGNVSVQGGAGIPGSTITITGPATQTTTTDASGNYSFAIPVANTGNYTITQTNLANYTNVSDVDGANDNIIAAPINFMSVFNRNYVDATANLSITKSVSNATPVVGTNVTFTLTASNAGPSTATSVVVNDLLASGYTFVSFTSSQGAYNSATGVWTVGTLNNGANATLNIVATIKNAGDFNNIATISGAQGDLVAANNTSANVPTNPRVSGTCNTNVLTNPSFETPDQGTVNVNHLYNSPYQGWTTQNGAQLNIIKVNGTAYANGPDNAHGAGNQYLDIANAADYPTQTFTITVPSTFSYSAWFSNRDSTVNPGGYVPWTGTVDIINASDVVVGTSASQAFTVTTPAETWYYVSGVTQFLPPGTYRFRGLVGNFGHMDDAYLCITPGIDAVNDTFATPIAAGASTPTVFTNDTIGGVAGSVTATSATATLVAPPAGFTINPNGTIAVAATVPSGTYTLTYQICEVAPNTADCDTATVTFTVANVIDAVNDPTITVPTTNAIATVGNVLTNDTRNGVAATTANTNITPITTGPLSISNNGVLTLAANTPSGTYTITYQLCESNPANDVNVTPANCDTAVATVIVANVIDAVNDPTITVATTAAVSTVGNVITNDTFNGAAVTTANTNVTPITTGPLSINTNGILTLAANTPSGTYTITYQLCESNSSDVNVTPANCDTAVATVVVANVIDAVNDPTVTVASGATAVTALTVTTNDTLNGVLVTNANTNVTVQTAGPLSINVNGVVTVAANTPSGTYTITYQLCESNSSDVNVTPANCDTATATVIVKNVIDAVNDPTITVATAAVASTVGNVITNDTLNGVAVTTANTNVTPITTGPLSINNNGVLTLAANTPSGTYTITYQLCESNSSDVNVTPANCDTATATVVVNNVIDAVNDPTITVPTSAVITTVGNVTTNDTLHGAAVTTANTNVTPITTGPLSINNNGVLTLAANTPSGTYTITYQLCESNPSNDVNLTPANCDTATATVVVANVIDAVTDPTITVATTAAISTVGNVITNDTLNGVAVTTANTNVTPITTGPLSINNNGVITLAANTPSGTYTITYQLCESNSSDVNVTPANCDTAVATVIVNNVIDAVNDPTITVATAAVASTVGNVITNDTLNGAAVTTANTNVTPITTGPLSINNNGVLTLAANTPSGTYTITYQLCESNSSDVNVTPANCDTAVATVVVNNIIDAVNDPTITVATTAAIATIGNVTTNDTLHGAAVTTANTNVTPVTNGPLSINNNGVLTLAANTPSGTYTITYQLCESNSSDVNITPANCDTATATVVVNNVIDAVNDPTVTVASGATAVTALTVTTNDTLNGVVVTTANTNVTPQTAGPLSINSNGVVTVAANTPSGTYTINYQLCESNASDVNVTPANCDTATATVVVANLIDAVNDSVNTPSSAAVTTIGNVTTNDTLNGVAVTTANTNVTPITTGPLSINNNGVLTLAANTPTGTYTITYQLCESNSSDVNVTPANCDTATATVVVGNVIDAVNDPTITVATTTAISTIGNVITNDTLNGVAVTTANTNVTPITTGPLSINSNGVLTLAANTPSGTYTITYQLCESNSSDVNVTPANCDTAVATVIVNNVIDAVNDPTITVATAAVASTVGNVITNDTLNGVTVTTANTNVTPITTGPLSINNNGVITLAANTPSGTYTITYQLCESNSSDVNVTPANCDTATATVVVNNIIDAVNDPTITVATGTASTTVGNVTTNDTLHGAAVTTANTNVTPITTGPLSINNNGVLTLAANTPTGTYSITYQICESNSSDVNITPANCDTATATVVVNNVLDAVDDPTITVATAAVASTIGNVTANDTLNGTLVTTANTNVTPITTGPLSINNNGVVTLAANTPSGTYTITYQICESNASDVNVTPANCDTATATFVVNNIIDAVNDPAVTVATSAAITTVGNVTANDTLHGAAVTTANTNVTPITTGPLSINNNGVLTLAANTPSGTYTITYQLCESNSSDVNLTPANCDTATATVIVANALVANDDTVGGLPGQTTGSVFGNDTFNGISPVNPATITLTVVTPNPNLTLNPDGTITIAPGTPAGPQTLVYQICENGVTPANCDTATVTVNVGQFAIDAVADNYTGTPINGTTGGTTPTVLANDTLNGIIVTPAQVILTTVGTPPAGLTLNPNGTVSVAAGTSSGTYILTYQICEAVNTSNCDTATATILVSNIIDAVNDPTITVATTAAVSTIGNVSTNDTLNGVIVTTANTNVTPITTGPLSINNNGVLTIAANTPSGTYSITYQICESNSSDVNITPANCDSATQIVIVNNVLVAVTDPAITVATTGAVSTVGNVTTNDTLNGVAVTTANTNVTPITTGPLSINTDGILMLAANTPSGTYTITYQICESNPANDTNVTPANCSSTTATVVVNNVINAVDDTTITVATTGAISTIGNVTTNDTLNATAVTTTNTNVTPITTGPLSINNNGVLTLAANTPSGTYSITYQLCESNSSDINVTPANCDTATQTVVVANVIDAVNDPTVTIASSATVVTALTVTTNDTLNGVLVTNANTNVTPQTAGPLSIDVNGVVTVAANTPTGTYTITYQLCESNSSDVNVNPANCDTATATVVVANAIDAVNDSITTPTGTAITTIGNVITNDTLNGVLVTTANTNVTPLTTGPLSVDTNGVLTLAANTPTGTYTITYQLCESNSSDVNVTPANCDTATATVVVTNVINAVDDAPVTVATTAAVSTIGNVTTNDTLNGVIVTTANTNVTPITTGPLSVDTNGVLTLAANTPSGTYTITYQLCESNTSDVNVTPANCDTATATVVVNNVIDAVVDPAITVATTNAAATVGNVIANDILNGVFVTTTNTNVTPITTGPLSINTNGVLTLAANTPSGTYTITYQLCESNPSNDVNVTPANCDTATATVIVNNIINAVDDAPVTVASGATAVTALTVTTNDTLNGVLVTTTNTNVTPQTAGPLSINNNGAVTVAANTPSGTYTITYQLCESNSSDVNVTPANCDTATATVVVANIIDAVNDPVITVATSAATATVGNVITNDTLNGVLVSTTNTNVTPITTGPLSISNNGVLTLAPNTPSGTYSITYQLCESNPATDVNVTPANCDTATATVVVNNVIDAVNDSVTTPSGTAITTIANVATNDTLNGVAVTTANTNVTPITSGPLTIDNNGVVTLAANTASGTYTITYQLCESNSSDVNVTPANCDTATLTVVVNNVIDAVNDPTVTVASGATTVTALTVTTNDTLNGVVVTNSNTNVTPQTAGPLTIDGNGVVSVAANTPSGTYTITYQLCESNSSDVNVTPANCDTATATVVVANTIDAVNDPSVTVASTNAITTVGNVATNDTLNGVAVTTANTNVTPITTGPLSINTNGVLTLAANTPSGTYTITYQICESNSSNDVNVTPANCDTATATVVVANTIDAVNDPTITVATTATIATIGNVITNDTLNGTAVTTANTNVTPITTGPLSIDNNGVLTLAANTPSGTYTITYQLCESNPSNDTNVTPANCDTATATVVVNNVIDAVNDPAITVATSATPTPVGNVITNDTLNGVAVTTSNTNVTPITSGPLSIDTNGVITLAGNAPSGTYTITYQLCESNATDVNVTPANCDTATATVVVNNLIDAVNDPSVTVASEATPVTALTVTTNDTLNGVLVTNANTNVTPQTSGPLTIDTNGVVTVAANTPSGTYTITYQLCESNATDVNVTPANCDTATATVVVNNVIDAVNDSITTPSGTAITTIGNVATNDTLNGVPVTTTNTNITPITSGPLSINNNGVVTLAANTPSGTYSVTYQLCESNSSDVNVTPANCDTATLTVVVGNIIDAVNDAPVTVASGATPVTAITVTNNDTLNGVIVNNTNTNVTPQTAGPLSIDVNGVVTVAANTPSGTYTITYQLCESNSSDVNVTPANCDTATATIIVANVIVANDDTTGGLPGQTTGSVLGNDTTNGVPPIDPSEVILTTTVANPNLTLNPDGTITIAPGTPAGPQTLQYQICEIGVTPPNCDTATVTVNVGQFAIDANEDDFSATPINGTTGGTTTTVLANDTLNGVVVTPAQITLTTVGTPPTGLTLNPNGTIAVAAGTPSGIYVYMYQICETINPTNCDSATATVVVNNVIDAVNDPAITVATTAAVSTIGNVITNDTLNGVAVTTTNTNVTPVTTGPLSINNNGVLTLAANTPSGTYTITYQLCESNLSDVNVTPANCDTATATVVVNNTIDAVADPAITVASTGVIATIGNVTTNDTLNGAPVTTANTNVTPITTGPLSINNNGVVTLAPNTPSGTYTITYQLCESNSSDVNVTPANCDTATLTVVVNNVLDAVNDAPVTIASSGTIVTALTVTTNDTLNGVLVTNANTNVTPQTSGPLTIDGNGVVTVAANTPSGTYTITYQLCESNITDVNVTPANCDTATATVVVNNTIDAVNDAPVTVASSGTIVTALTVTTNDTLNGVLVTNANTNVTPQTSGPLTIDGNGVVTIAANTPSGTYTITYQLCESNSSDINVTPANCDTATATVVVANTIDAVNDPAITVATTATTATVGNVIINDTLNGVAVTTANTNVTPITTGPLSINNNGVLTLAANTPSGTYTITYQLCESDSSDSNVTPPNCDTATATVVVANTIDAVNEPTITVATTTAIATVGNVITNDTLNGVAVTTANTNVTPITTGPLSINNNGVLTLAANTPSGTYTITYQLCESNPSNDANVTPANCDTATATVVVNNVIDAVIDPTITVATTAAVATIGNVTTNDTLNGIAVTTANTNVTPITTGPLSINTNGVLTLAANTPSGTYTITYQLCESDSSDVNVTPANCDTATATVVVNNVIDAVNDPSVTTPSVATITTIGNVTANDTLNGVPVTTANTNVTPITTGPLSIDTNGVLTLAANAPSGTYTITYQLCESNSSNDINVTPANCDTATATVVVANVIDAVVDTITASSGNAITTIGNVATNDTLNGVPVTTANTNVTPITTGPISINTNGVVTLAANTPSGTYTITYQICESNASDVNVTPANCDTATLTVVVNNVIDAVNEPTITVGSTTAISTIGNVITNDTLNGAPVNTANTNVTPITTGPLSISNNGILTLAPSTPSGTYTITYQLCESNLTNDVNVTPANCDTATVTVIVANTIVANDDTTGGLPGQTTGSVLGNDTLNGVPPVSPSDIILTTVTPNPALTLNPDGSITITPGTPAGPQTLVYQICEIGVTPANCDTGTVTVNVGQFAIDAVVDNYSATPINGVIGGTTATVLANDTLNAVVVTPSQVILTTVGTPPTGLTLNPNGTITVAAGTPSGTYNLNYQICETINPTNCDISNAIVVVTNVLDAINDPTVTVASGATPTSAGNVTTNDTLNGVPVTTANTDVTPVTAGPLSVDADGNVTVAPNTPTGTYTVTYTICEVGAVPANCDTATATITVTNVIDAVIDPSVTVTSGATPTSAGNVTANDTLNGVPVTTANTDVTPVTAGPLSIDADGNVTVAPNTPSGVYTITYTVCEVAAVPANCDTATATITVTNVIDAVNDPTVTVASSTAVTSAGNVTTNDTLNGVPVTAANTDVTPVTTGPLSIDANGNVSVAANTPSGSYTITYTICEVGAVPANCDTATLTVVVNNGIDAVNDPTVTVATTAAILTIGNVTTNDTLNGVAVTTTNTNVTPITTGPLSINNNGVLTLAANTPSGTYVITYQLCESNSADVNVTPANCDTATATIVVANTIDAVNDPSITVISGTTPTLAGNVTTNDTLNGVPVTAANTDVTQVTNGPLSIDANGNVIIAPNTPSGVYTITYTICEVGAVPANCDTATATITVANVIDAVNDPTVTVSSGATPTTVGNVTTNDTLNGVPVTAANTDVTPVNSGQLSIDANGVLTLGANTPSGTYTITYTICEAGAVPANCDTATATVVVNNVIDAVNDPAITATSGTTPTAAGNVATNDTLNGVPVTAANTDVTPVTAGPISIDANGNITIAPNTPSGVYTVTYTICEAGAVPANCDTATVTITVTNILDALNDPTVTIASGTAPTAAGNVTTNDTLNGVPVTAANTDVTPVTSGPLSIDANGNVTVAPNTPSGTYTITYTICEVGAVPANCDTATATVVVNNVIDAVNDPTVTVTSGTAATAAGNVTTNDTLNGVAVTAANTDVTPITTGPLSIDANGNVTVGANTPSGTYTITYTICEVGAVPANCDTATATVVVNNVIDAVNDPITVISGTTPTAAGNITTNDTLNGVPVTTANTDVTPVTAGPISIDADGNVTVAPNTPSGVYTVTYTICEVGAVPANCDTATVTITVANILDAVNDPTVTVTSGTAITPAGNVTTNDTLNGVPVTVANTDVTPITTGPLSVDANGNVTVAPNTPSGTYTVTYTICEVGAVPANCDTATTTVVVNNVIDAVNDPAITTTSGPTPTSAGNVTINDTLNGVPVTTANTDVTPVTAGLISIDADGNITIAPNTPSGVYTITYTICETGAVPANCDTATATITVTNVIIANDDTNATPVNGYQGGVAIPSVLTNDTLNGAAVVGASVNITLTSVLPTGILFNTTTGAVTVASGTPAGTYTFTYNLCENGAVPANCDPATVTIIVSAPTIVAQNDNFSATPVNGYDGDVVGNIFDNNGSGEDTLNGLPVLDAEVQITLLDNAGLTNLAIANDGTITVPAGTPAGTYVATYQICDVLNPGNCDTATITIVVVAPILVVNNDDYTTTPINSDLGGQVGSVFDNDTLNNSPINPADVIVQIISDNPINATVSNTGIITIPAGTPAGTYTIIYQVCQVSNPTNCEVGTVIVVVRTPCELDNSPVSCDIIIHNAITVNDDGANDSFIIEGVESFPNNELEIYNRWGILVYEAKGYNNGSVSFKGISEGRSTVKQGSGLPEGTYFYTFRYSRTNGNTREKAGYLYISRK